MNGTKTVLVVDDDEDIRIGMRQLLRNRGYRVLTARDGEEALELLAAPGAADLMVLDLGMPKLHGFEVLSRLSADGVQSMPVIILTARTSAQDLCEGFLTGAAFYITKPFQIEVLLGAVDYLVGDLPPEEMARCEADLLTSEGVYFCLRAADRR